MTEITFHFNAPDKMDYACRFLRKAYNLQAKVMVTGSLTHLENLDRALWTLSPQDFIPHCMLDAPEHVLSRSPIVLADQVSGLHTLPHHQMLLNLEDVVPQGFEKFERVIELVSLEQLDREFARARWKTYQDRGYAIIKHDLKQKASAASTTQGL
jgi:DNA polymerase III subunit chi